MSEIEILQDAIREDTIFYFLGGLVLMMIGIIGAITSIMMERSLITIIGIIIMIFGVILIFGGIFIIISPQQNELDKLIEQRNEALDKKLKSLSCTELRLDILDILENEKEKYIEKKLEWEQDYYYHKCEIPLREEILKLQ